MLGVVVQSDHDRSVHDIALLEQDIQNQNNELTRVEQLIQKIEHKLDLLGGEDRQKLP